MCFAIQDPRSPYIIYFNFQKETIDIIKVTSLSPEAFSEAKSLKYFQAQALSKYLQGKIRKAGKIANFTVQEMILEWDGPKNSWCDAGLYLMRYMETYKGDMKAMDPQLKHNSDAMLKKLRVKYCHSILINEVNSLKEIIEKKAREYSKLKI